MIGGENMDSSGRISDMDNRELEPVEAAPLPLSAAHENPPLVVDLPEGQKLVVGNLDPGVVIEVATWRGTGRPDSRTSRLMLGVSTNEDEGIPASRALPPVTSSPRQITNEQSDVDERVAPRVINSEQVKTGIIYSNLNPTTPSREIAIPEKSKVKKNIFSVKKVLIASGSIASIAAFAIVVFGFLGLRFVHPESGIKTSMGASNTTVALIKPAAKLEIGKTVVSDLISKASNPNMSVIAAIENDAILLATEQGYEEINSNRVRGKVVLLFPFIGSVANIF